MGAHPTAQAAATKEHTLLLAVRGFTTWLRLTGKLHKQLSQQLHKLHRLVSQQLHQLQLPTLLLVLSILLGDELHLLKELLGDVSLSVA